MAKKLSQLTAISNVGDTPANVIFGISNTASGTSNTITLSSLSAYLDSTFATDIASQANVGAGLITVTSAYQANTNIYTDSRSTLSQKVYVDYANGSGVLVTGEVVRSSSKNKTGTVVYFANNSGGTLVVSDLNDLLEEDDVIVGDYSNATYTINTVDLNPLKTVASIPI